MSFIAFTVGDKGTNKRGQNQKIFVFFNAMSLSLEKFFLKGSKIIAYEEVILRFVEREYLRRSQRYENFD